ncbi:MAG TPA: hypothetical protein VJ825_15275 [Gemmatimonadaceae bacterium]|nr:hypothetical protein [Gemmatimonadaceae bacterium]
MSSQTVLSAFCVGLCISTACSAQNSSAVPGVDARDLEVYTAVLDSMFTPRSGSAYSQIAVDVSTEVLPRESTAELVATLMKAPGVDSAIARDVVARSYTAHSLTGIAGAHLPMPVLLVDSASIASLPRADIRRFWSEFYTRFPRTNGLIRVSAIGYSADHNRAALMVDVGCGGLCGNGYIVVVNRAQGRWRIANITGTWVS